MSAEAPAGERPGGGPGRRRLGWLAAAGLTVIIVVWLLAFSPVLGVKHVTVRGTSVLTAAQVSDAAAVAHGTPLLRLNTDDVASRVERLPDVASASVSTSLPSTVTITVTERIAVGYVSGATGFLLVDKTGRQFRSVPAAPPSLPKFDVPPVAAPDGPTADPTGQAVATVAAALPAAVRALLSSISATTPVAITLNLTDGRTVQWGSAAQSDVKASLITALLAQPGKVFDVSDPAQVYSR